MSSALAAGAAPRTQAPVVQAVRNTLTLGSTLAVTWAVALVVRFWLPRALGPGAFGQLTSADAFASTAFAVLGLGVDTYIRKEVPVRPQHASEFFGGVLLARLLMSAAVFGGMWAVMVSTGRPVEVRQAALVFGVAQVLLSLNESLAALLQAQGEVSGLSAASVAGKLLWAGALFAAVLSGASLPVLGGALVLGEGLKGLALTAMVRKHLGLRLQISLSTTWAVLVASLPFYLNTLAHTAYAKVDVSILAVLTNDDAEVGWYGAAAGLAGLTLFATPLIGWVLMPLLARAAAQSREELGTAVRRSLELLLFAAIPGALVLALGAELWVRLIFGAAFAPAAGAVRVLAPMLVLTYVATLCACTLVLANRGWSLTAISLSGLLLNPLLNLVLIRPCLTLLGPSGGGVGCALAISLTEVWIASCMLACLRGLAFDGRSVGMALRALVAAALAVAADRLLAGMGPVRLAVDLGVYAAGVAVLRAVPRDGLFAAVRSVRRAHARA